MRVENPAQNGGQALPDCAATGRKCKKPECLNDNGNYCKTSVGVLISFAGDRKIPLDDIEIKVTRVANELQVDRKSLRRTVKKHTRR